MNIWFWQLIVSPHMADLVKALSDLGHDVTYVAQKTMSGTRRDQGWEVPDLGGTKLLLAPTKEVAKSLATNSPEDAVHICQGIRGNGLISVVQRTLKDLGRDQLIVMEMVDDSGVKGLLKRIIYRFKFSQFGGHIKGVLATGSRTRDWVIARGVPPEKVFSFAYFLPYFKPIIKVEEELQESPFQILYVGRLVEVKRVDLLIEAIYRLGTKNISLRVVGTGPLEMALRQKALAVLPVRVEWVGSIPLEEVRVKMAQADCLVLPSSSDGWGAVVSEALMSGTPVICSDACGSSVVVRASGYGGVFKSNNVDDLIEALDKMLCKGSLTKDESFALREWAACLGGEAGAKYLISILESIDTKGPLPEPPWLSA